MRFFETIDEFDFDDFEFESTNARIHIKKNMQLEKRNRKNTKFMHSIDASTTMKREK